MSRLALEAEVSTEVSLVLDQLNIKTIHDNIRCHFYSPHASDLYLCKLMAPSHLDLVGLGIPYARSKLPRGEGRIR